VPNLSLAWLTTNRVQSFFASSASADIAGLGALLLGAGGWLSNLANEVNSPCEFLRPSQAQNIL